MRTTYGRQETPQMAFDIVPPLSPGEAMARATRHMPSDDAGLIAAARSCLTTYDKAMTEGDGDGLEAAKHRMEAIAFKMADGAQFQTEAQWQRMQDALRADDGMIPKWGQPGRFVVTAAGCRVLVEITDLFGDHFQDLECHAVDFALPFLTATGFVSIHPYTRRQDDPVTVDGWVIAHIERNQETYTGWNKPPKMKKLVAIAQDYRGPEDPEAPAWQPGGWLYELAQNPPAIPKPARKRRVK